MMMTSCCNTVQVHAQHIACKQLQKTQRCHLACCARNVDEISKAFMFLHDRQQMVLNDQNPDIAMHSVVSPSRQWTEEARSCGLL